MHIKLDVVREAIQWSTRGEIVYQGLTYEFWFEEDDNGTHYEIWGKRGTYEVPNEVYNQFMDEVQNAIDAAEWQATKQFAA